MEEQTINPPLPPEALAQFREGTRRLAARDLQGALAALRAALAIVPGHPDILEQIAIVAAEGGDPDSAERILRALVDQLGRPAHVARLALLLNRRQCYAEAVSLFSASLGRLPFIPELYDAFIHALERIGDHDRALSIIRQIHDQAPTAENAVKLAAAMLRQGRAAALHEVMPGLLARWPDDPELLDVASVMALGLGHYPEGFGYLRRGLALALAGGGVQRLAHVPVWDGQPFRGTLLVTTEPHLGEEIQVSAMLDAVQARVDDIVVEVDPRMVPLFARTWPRMRFVARDAAGDVLAACVPADGNCRRAASLDLMELLGRRPTLPGPPGWLKADPERVAEKRAEYEARWPGKRRIGICWRSARMLHGLDLKSVPLTGLPHTLALAGVVYVSLQYGDPGAELAQLAQSGLPAPWVDPAIDTTNDMDGLAAQMLAMDHVVSVSNTNAHLAGALGVPTTVLLPKRYPVLWHWGFHGDETTWYGSVRLLRNPEDAGWAAVDTLLSARLCSVFPR